MAEVSRDYVWWLEGDKLGFGYIEDGKMKTLATGGKTLRIYFKRLPTHLGTTLSEKPEVAPEFHEGIMSRVLEKLHARIGNLPSARYYRAEWQDCIKMGKERSNREKDGTEYHFEIEEF
jgi:hypothetical protein